MRMAAPPGLTYSAHALRRGKRALSSSSTRSPRVASRLAVALPAFGLFFSGINGTTVAAVALADVGIATVGTLLGAMAVAGRARELLLPLLFLPLAIPIVVGGVGASVGEGSRYLVFLAAYDAIFTLVAWASFEYVVSET